MRTRANISWSFFTLCIILSGNCCAQQQANNWYFGQNAAISFRQSPPLILNDNVLKALEGCASISDANGNLLFYSNGLTVKNKQHVTMANGDGLLGDLSSTNNVLIIPDPGAQHLYYLFTIGVAGRPDQGLRYSIIDMQRNSGLGEVTSKNVLLQSECYEKLAAVRHCNKKDVWITVKNWNSSDYTSYLISPTGISTPVVSTGALLITGETLNALGCLKFSGDGKKLAALHAYENDIVELMSFDNATGIISNPILFRPSPDPVDDVYRGIYGAEFSPGNNLLYVSSFKGINETSILYQFDVSVADQSAILASRQVITSNGTWTAGGLQLGIDGKIYFSMGGDTSLSVIHNPDIQGPGCNFQLNGLTIASSGQPVQFGLPGFIASDLSSVNAPYDFSATANCIDLGAMFAINNLQNIDSVKWNFGDGSVSTSLQPGHIYSAPGQYNVSLSIFKQDCGGPVEIITHPVTVRLVSGEILPADAFFCQGSSVEVSALVPAASYTWSSGERVRSKTISAPGSYWLEILENGCTLRDSISFSYFPIGTLDLGPDKQVCINKPETVTAIASLPVVSYLWNNGSSNASIDINTIGSYWVTATDVNGCEVSDTIKAIPGNCDIFIAGAFSPNGDGINETFGLITGLNSPVFKMHIYNRFGQLIFSSNDPLKRWDGKFKNKPLPVGAYTWMITFKNREGFIQTDKGQVLLIR